MKPYYQRGPVTLYHADCLDWLPTRDAGSVDAFVTDPPYGVGFKYESHDDSPVGYPEWCRIWFAQLRRIAGGPIGISCGIANLSSWEKADWVLCWHKPAAMGRCAVGFNNWEPVLVYGKTRAGTVVDVFSACIVPDDSLSGHPCPKPVGWGIGVIERLTKAGDLVCDPFTGSGTTAVACVRTGRRFAGCEIEEKYCEIAAKRIDRELDQGRLFDKPEPQPVQKTLMG